MRLHNEATSWSCQKCPSIHGRAISESLTRIHGDHLVLRNALGQGGSVSAE